MFHSYFERKNDKVLTFNIVHFPNFEISGALSLAPPSNKRRTSQFQNLIMCMYVLHIIINNFSTECMHSFSSRDQHLHF